MKLANILNNPQLITYIMSEIKKRGELPEWAVKHSIFAGGGVNALVFNWAYGMNFPINDIDLFVNSLVGKWEEIEFVMPCRRHTSTLGLEDDYGMIKAKEIAKGSYSVVKSYRDGIFNYVRYLCLDGTCHLSPLNIIKGFDINYCQIAFDFMNKEFVWTPAYEEFFNTMQLKITGLWTPWHTLIRLARKHKEFDGSYCNLEDEMKLVASYIDKIENMNIVLMKHNKGDIDSDPQVELSFGESFKNKFEGIVDVFGDKLSLVEKGDGLFTIAHNIDSDVPAFNVMQTKEYCQPSTYLQIWRRGFDITVPKKKKNVFFNALSRTEDNFMLRHKTIYLPSFATHDNVSKLSSIKRKLACGGHNIEPLFINCKTTESFEDGFKFIKDLVDKHGDWVYGILETNILDITKPENRERIINSIVKASIDDFKQLVVPFCLEGFKYNGNVKQLVTQFELKEEGRNMRHCVGGYADPVAKMKSFIFHIDDMEGNSSTVEYRFSNARLGKTCGESKAIGVFNLAQNRSRFNTRPSDKCIEIGVKLLEYLISIYVPFIDLVTSALTEEDPGF